MADKYAVIGNPVTHSKSPLIHAEFARQAQQDMSYVVIGSSDADFEATVQRFRAAGGRGMNVTLPFKHRAFALAQERTARAADALAVNTLSFREGGIFGDNTDGIGLVRDLTVNLGRPLTARRILLMGAGGASFGVCGPLLDETPSALVIANRTLGKATALCERFSGHPNAARLQTVAYPGLAGMAFDIVVNATSASLTGDMPALPGALFAPGALAYDMVYGRSTPFLDFARSHGAEIADGLGMLIEQAAESFFIWRGVRPETLPVIALIREPQR